MEYAYATCILNESGEEINEQNLKAVLEAAGCPVQESRVKAIVAALEDIEVTTGVDFAALGADDPEDAEDAEPEASAASEPAADDGKAAVSEMDIIPAEPMPVETDQAESMDTDGAEHSETDETERPDTVAGDGRAEVDPDQSPGTAEPAAGSDGDGG